MASIGPDHPLLILSGVQGDTRRYRSFHPYQQLRLAGIPATLSHLTAPDLPVQVAQTEVIILHRTPMDGYVSRLMKDIRKRGGLVLLDIDDLLFDPDAFHWIDSPDFSDRVRAALYKDEMRRQRETLAACDAILASTSYLVERARALGKPAWVHRNAFSLEMLAVSEQAHSEIKPNPGQVVIGYASGTPTHDQDFNLAAPALMKVLNNHPDAVLWVIGPLQLSPQWADYGSQVRHLPFEPWRKLPALLAQFDINLAPLVPGNPFSQSKSEIKYMEAGLVQVPTIASPTPAFSQAIQSGENGFLAQDMTSWTAALEQLLDDPTLRSKMAAEAHRRVRAEYPVEVRSVELTDTLNQVGQSLQGHLFWSQADLLEMSRNRQQALLTPERFWIPVESEFQPTLSRRAQYILRHRGLLPLLGMIWVQVRRWLAPLFPFARKVFD